MTNSKRCSITSALATSLWIAALMTGCSTTPPPDLAHARQVADNCPNHRSIATFVASDESQSRLSSTSQPDQLNVIRTAAERTAICGGYFRLSLFGGSVVTSPVLDTELTLAGATEASRLRKAPRVVDTVMSRVKVALPAARSKLTTGDATDISGQLQLASEYVQQLDRTSRESSELQLTLLTDGIETAQVSLQDQDLTVVRAKEVADRVQVPDLSGADVRLIGIGRQAGGQSLPTPYIEALRAYHLTVCARSKAAHCTVVTDQAGQ